MPKHAVAALALTCFASAAVAAPPDAAAPNPATGENELDQLRSLVKTLQSQVEELKARDDDQWLTERRADEIRGLVHDVLADADTRASLLQTGMTAGYDKNFFIGSADGNYLLKIAGQMQFRWVYNSIDSGAEDEEQHGFENRRTKLRFFGHAIDPSWQYLVLGAFERDGGLFVLDEAFITKDLENGSKIRFGQFKPPFLREELVSSSRQLAVERSLVNEEFNQDRGQGVEYSYTGERFRLAAAYTDGFLPGGAGSDNTSWALDLTEWGALTGRVDFIVIGDDWKAFDDFQGWREGANALMVGGAVHYQEIESGILAADEVTFLGLTADATFKGNGFGAYAAIVYRSLDDTTIDVEQMGFVVQGSIFFADDWEAFARYEWADADMSGVEDLSVFTIGVNKYFKKHDLKWQADIGFGLDEVASIWSTSSAGWRTDPVDEDGQFVLRTQLQLLF